MAEIWPIRRKTLSNQSLTQSINQSINKSISQSIDQIIRIVFLPPHIVKFTRKFRSNRMFFEYEFLKYTQFLHMCRMIVQNVCGQALIFIKDSVKRIFYKRFIYKNYVINSPPLTLFMFYVIYFI